MRPEKLDATQLRRLLGTRGTTCQYCGIDANDDDFNCDGDIKDAQKYIEWPVARDISDIMENMTKKINRSQPKGSLFSLKMDFRPNCSPETKAWREDFIRNLECDICGREYGVYAIALFCLDCGSMNLHVIFEQENELILQQIDLAGLISEQGDHELSYRILGNDHEDVVTALENYQKAIYKYMVNKSFSGKQVKKG